MMERSVAARAPLDRASLTGLIRPRIVALVLVSAASAFLIERPATAAALPWLLLGTGLVAAAGCALNHWLERDADARMTRTARRPLVTGALRPREVVVGGTGVALIGLAVLALGCNLATAGLQALAAAIYLGLYTPLKRRTSTNTWIGALPGALPVLAGSAAARGAPSLLAWMVFCLVFVWQMPHFFAIASLYREEYGRGGLRVLSGDDPEDRMLRWALPLLVMSVILVSMGPGLIGQAGLIYLVTSLLAGFIFLVAAFRFRARPDRAAARRVVLASVLHLPAVLGALVLDVRPAAPAGDASGLPDHGRLPAFELVDQDGAPFDRERMLGERWIVDFIFTRCSGVCRPMTEGFVALQAEPLPARFLSVSVDATGDGPEQLRAFRDEWAGDAERWTLVVGRHDDVMALANEAFRLPAGTGAAGPEGLPELFHSQRYALVDARGVVRGYYAHDDALELERLRRDLRSLADAGR